MDFAEYLRLEGLLYSKLADAWGEEAEKQFPALMKLVKAKQWDAAAEAVYQLDLSPVGDACKEVAAIIMRATIDFGARVAGGGTSLTSSLTFNSAVEASVEQLRQGLEWSATAQMHKQLLQLIAVEKQRDQEAAELKKAEDPLKGFTSFKEVGDEQIQLISSLHSNRLGSWGFLAEADLIGLTYYKLNAQLDNRTSDFCRLIHGKIFRVEDARPLIERAIHSGDPNDLKQIQPWPKQTKAAIEAYKAMSDDQLVAAGLHAPPYHPNCRTIMIRVNDVVKLTKPTSITVSPLPSKVATAGDFSAIGSKITDDALKAWNDYLGVDPGDVLALLSGMKKVDFVDNVVSGSVKVDSSGKVKFAWQSEVDSLSVSANMVFDGATGTLKITKLALDGDAEDVALYLEKLRDALLSFVSVSGAEVVQMPVKTGQAASMVSLGFLPSQTNWNKFRAGMKTKLTKGSYTAAFDALPENVRQTVLDLLASPNVQAMQVLLDLDLPPSLVYGLFGKMEFLGYMKE